MAAALAIVVAMAGCRESEDGIKETKETMNWEQYIKNVNEHIIGTWQHDGVYYGSEGYHLILDDDHFASMDKTEGIPLRPMGVSLTFRKDGTCVLDAADEGKTSEGKFTISTGLYLLDVIFKPAIPGYGSLGYGEPWFERGYNILYIQNGPVFHRYKRVL